MTDKQLRALSKIEMLAILQQQEHEIEKLSGEKKALSQQQLNSEQIGSLAEISAKASGIMKAAQDKADIYLESINRGGADEEKTSSAQEGGLIASMGMEHTDSEHISEEKMIKIKQSFRDTLNLFEYYINKLSEARDNVENTIRAYKENLHR